MSAKFNEVMPVNVHALNSKFSHKGNIFFNKKADLIIAKIDNKYACCSISLYGAQVLSYEPQGEENVLWMSKKSFFEYGKAIRGGVPVCFPWFGPHSSDLSKPQHGFARLSKWEPDSVSSLEDGATRLVLKISDNSDTLQLWPYKFEAKVIITVGAKLEIALEVYNKDTKAFEYTDALHSYFNISSAENIHISGLQGAKFHDGLSGDSLKTQEEKLLLFTKEENRRYIGHSSTCVITDKGFKRELIVEKTNSHTTVVWNPWEETTKKISDMEPNGYKSMVCVEAVNAYSDVVKLNPGESFRMSTILSMHKL